MDLVSENVAKKYFNNNTAVLSKKVVSNIFIKIGFIQYLGSLHDFLPSVQEAKVVRKILSARFAYKNCHICIKFYRKKYALHKNRFCAKLYKMQIRSSSLARQNNY
jgi:hypothetical protein